MRLDLTTYTSDVIGAGRDLYDLYAVVVHLDMLNASFFGHYICYIKDHQGQWYRVDDCKVIFCFTFWGIIDASSCKRSVSTSVACGSISPKPFLGLVSRIG